MTARSLMRAVAGSPELVVAGMRERALTTVDGLESTGALVLDEPVFRRDNQGRLRQAVRLGLSHVDTVTRAWVADLSGVVDTAASENGLPATVRLFVPEVSAPRQYTVELQIAGQRRQGTVTVRPCLP